MEKIIEIRNYQLKPGYGQRFQQLLDTESLSLHAAAGIDVVLARASLDNPDSYVLIRAFESQADCEQLLHGFYASDAWQKGPRMAILACIASTNVVLLPVSTALLTQLRLHDQQMKSSRLESGT